jgi:hypothetical protein
VWFVRVGAELNRVVEVKDKHLADKDKQLAEKDRALKAAVAALAFQPLIITSTRTRGALCPLGRIERLSLLQVSCAKLHCKPMARAS